MVRYPETLIVTKLVPSTRHPCGHTFPRPVPNFQALKGKKAVALYFSAHWCPPCRGFTPQLATWYKQELVEGHRKGGDQLGGDLKEKGMEVIFVSGDRDEGSFKEYFAEQPWLSVDFNDKELADLIQFNG
eukprot:Skav215581  [mRNA]  locus=scaffold666:32751:33944:+ [translate_table: standard]